MTYPDLPKRALSIRQPWAHCIIHLGKPVENRSWSTKVRGPICIHASKAMTLAEWADGLETARYASAPIWHDGACTFPGRSDLQFGGIIGTVDIIDVVTSHPSPWFFGEFGFVLSDPRPVDFIPVKGALGFFDWRRNQIEVTA